MVRSRWVAFAALAGLLASVAAARADKIPWRSSLQEALAEAGRSNRLVMLSFSDSDCSWCDRMDRETFSDADVIGVCTAMIPVRLDVAGAHPLVRRFGIEGVPTVVFLESTGAEAGRSVGFVPPSLFITRVRRVLEEQERVAALRQRVAEEPDVAEAKAELARIYINRHQGELAAPLVDALTALPAEKAPKDLGELLLGTAISYGYRGDNDRALVYLDKVIKRYPGTEEAEWASLFVGVAWGMKGDRAAALRQIERVAATARSENVRERARQLLDRFREMLPPPSI